MTSGIRVSIGIFCLAFLSLQACSPGQEENVAAGGEEKVSEDVTSLLGETLAARPLRGDRKEEFENNLAAARADYEKDPKNLDNIIWLGRRTAYLGRYREAIDVYTKGLKIHPDSSKLLRHRGHRYITIRELDRAVADLSRAAKLVEGQEDEVEPDGMPNAQNIPTSTHQSNIWYHLGLAYYLQGNFDKALDAYRDCLKVSTYSDDMLVATTHWFYMTCLRLQKKEAGAEALAALDRELNVIENTSYLKMIGVYRGDHTPESLWDPGSMDEVDSASLGYGLANWYLVHGEGDRARTLYQKVLEGPSWAAFGRIAAEADMARGLD